MERSLSHDYPQPSLASLGSTVASSGLQRLKGVIVEINEVDGGGYIRLASRQFSFRAIDVVGSVLPKVGESASFLLTSDDQSYRASQVVLDSNPQFIRGQNSLQDCYQAHAKSRRGRMARQQSASRPIVTGQPAQQGTGYRHCQDCQRMVLPKLRRGRVKPKLQAVQWREFCPHCKSSLDDRRSLSRFHPLPFALLLGCLIAWILL